MARPEIEFPSRPIYGSERKLPDQEFSERTLAMYRSVINGLLSGEIPKKITTLRLVDSLGKEWVLDVNPKKSRLYVRQYLDLTFTKGFKTNPFSPEGAHFIEFWHRYNRKQSENQHQYDVEWAVQESEAILSDLITKKTVKSTSAVLVDP